MFKRFIRTSACIMALLLMICYALMGMDDVSNAETALGTGKTRQTALSTKDNLTDQQYHNETNKNVNSGTDNNSTDNNGADNKGTGSNGTGSKGTGSNGTGSNGTGSKGTGSNGTGSNGTDSKGTTYSGSDEKNSNGAAKQDNNATDSQNQDGLNGQSQSRNNEQNDAGQNDSADKSASGNTDSENQDQNGEERKEAGTKTDHTPPAKDIWVRYSDGDHTYEEQIPSSAEDSKDRYFNNKVTITIYVRDGKNESDSEEPVSGIDTIDACVKDKNGKTISNTSIMKDAGKATINNIEYDTYILTLSNAEDVNSGHLVIHSVTDHAGNKLCNDDGSVYAAGKIRIYIDTAAPKIALIQKNLKLIKKGKTSYLIGNRNFLPSYSVKDDNLGGGDQEAYQCILKHGNDSIWEDSLSGQRSITASTYFSGGLYKIPDKSSYYLDAADGKEEVYQSQFSYTDPAGNEADENQKIIIDKKSPDIYKLDIDEGNTSISDTVKGTKNGKIYLKHEAENGQEVSVATVNFQVEENYFSGDSGNITVQAVDIITGKTQNATVTVDSNTEITESRLWNCSAKFTFKEDGEWQVSVKAKDEAGNTSETITLAEKIITDFTSPKLNVTYTNSDSWHITDDSLNDMDDMARVDKDCHCYSSETIHAVITVTDDNLSVTDMPDLEFIQGKKVQFSNISDNGTTLTCELELKEEGQYQYQLAAFSDAAGNVWVPDQTSKNLNVNFADSDSFNKTTGDYISPLLYVDLTDPEISVTISKISAGDVDSKTVSKEDEKTVSKKDEYTADENGTIDDAYFNSSVLVTVTVKETNFRPEDFHIEQSAYWYDTDSDCKRINKDELKLTRSDELTWKTIAGQSSLHQASFKVEEEANYIYAYECKDLSGRASKKKEDTFIIDTSKPYINILNCEGSSDSDIRLLNSSDPDHLMDFINYSTYGYFSAKKGYAIIESHDAVSGVREIHYQFFDEKGQCIQEEILSDDSGNSYGRYTVLIPLQTDFKGTLKAWPVDRSGNIGDQRTPRGIVTESATKHQETKAIAITTKTKASRVDGSLSYYRTPVKLNMSVSDSQSGIQSYEYTAGTAISHSVNYKESYGTEDDMAQAGANVYQFSKSLTMEAGDVNYSSASHPTVATLTYQDNAGYTETVKKTYVIDSFKPEISVTWTSEASVLNEKYYNKTRIAHIVVTERNFYESGVNWHIRGTGASVGSWKHDGDTHTCDVTFEKDGDYQLMFTVTDLAGNSASCDEEEFVIDQTAPVISITFDVNDMGHGIYYNAARTAACHVTEHNFSPADVRYEMTASKNGKASDSPGPGAWNSSGDENTSYIKYDSDGEYTLCFTYTDLAGNVAKAIPKEHFIIDLTKPEITISGVSQGEAYNDEVIPQAEYKDWNLNGNSLKIGLTGTKNGVCNYKYISSAAGGRNGQIRWEDFARTQKTDDIYTLQVSISDKAGNVETKEITFSVNRFGSNYYADEETEKLLSDYYVNEVSDFTINEVNVDALMKTSVSVTNNKNEIVTLKEGIDYKKVCVQDENKWKKYSYVISKDVFEKEGYYQIRFDSTDQAGNLMSNELKDDYFCFIYDHTPPTPVVSGLEKDRYREHSHIVSIQPMDNTLMKTIDVYVNDELYQSYDQDECAKIDQVYTIHLRERDDPYKIQIVATDMAGNSTETSGSSNQNYSYKCVISSHWWTQFYYFFIDIFL